MKGQEYIVEIKDLIIEFDTSKGRKRVVDQISFEVAPGEVLGILGESGSGKTMSTQAILGLIDGLPGVMSGEINFTYKNHTLNLLDGLSECLSETKENPHKNDRLWQQKSRKTMKPLWGKYITAIFQNPRSSLDPLMTVGAQLSESITYASLKQNKEQGTPQKTTDQIRSEAIEWLEKVHMVNPARVYESYPHELSGGMCQRAMIAVALACRPTLLVADEPTTGLDATVRAQIVTLLQTLVREARCAMLYISHDIREVLYLTDRVIVMRHGQVIEHARTEDLKNGYGDRHTYTQSLLDASGIVEKSIKTIDTSFDHAQTEKRSELILEARGLKKSFIGRDRSITKAIDDVDLLLFKGEVAALIGESGSGKTTLGRAITRLLTLDEGEVHLDQVSLTTLKGAALRHTRKSFQVIFQNQQANLHPNLSVHEMLDESLKLHRPELNVAERFEHCQTLLARVGLTEHGSRYVASLSGGEQRRVGLARILATAPKLIVADEPTSGLDAAIKLQTIALLQELKGADLTYLLISHDLGLVRRIADRVFVMLRGRIIEKCSIHELGARPHHPYTEKLLAAAQLGDRPLVHDTASIEDLAYHEQGCGYASLCPLARAKGIVEQCVSERPELIQISESSSAKPKDQQSAVACFAYHTLSTERIEG